MSTKSAIVTGSEGFIGKHLVRLLESKGWDVTRIDLQHGKNARGLAKMGLAKVDVVFHLAAHLDRLQEDTIDSARGVVEYCKENGSWAVYASSCAIYNPQEYYGAQKLYGEVLLKQELKSLSILRFFNVYGEGGHGVVDKFLDSWKKKSKFTVHGSGIALRDYVHVNDIVNALYTAGNMNINGTFDVGTSHLYSVNNIIEYMQTISDSVIEVNRVLDNSLVSNSNAPRSAKLDPDFPWYAKENLYAYIKTRMVDHL